MIDRRIRFAAVLFACFFMVVSAQPTRAQELTQCFLRDECLKKGTTGNCDDQHCFDTGAGPIGSSAACAGSTGRCYVKWPAVNLSVSIGGATQAVDLGDYVARIYNYGVAIAALLAGFMFIVGGFQYLTAGGSDRAAAAKQRIKNATVGLILVLGAVLILNTINPDLLALKLPKIPLVKRKQFAACDYFVGDARCGEQFKLISSGDPTAPPSKAFKVASKAEEAAAAANCIGMSCTLAGLNDETYHCKLQSGSPTAGASTNAGATSSPGVGAVAPYTCAACTAYGQSCSPNGPNNNCCTGWCSNGECKTGYDGDDCNANNDCRSGICQTELGNSCSDGTVGSPCAADAECKNGNVCVERTGWYICVPPQAGGGCDADQACPAGSKCVNGYCTQPGSTTVLTCTNGPCPNGDKCLNAFSALCQLSKGNGAPCEGDGDCDSGHCISDAVTGPGGICSDGSEGSRCDKNLGNIQCKSGFCNTSGDFGVCTSGGTWAGCSNGNECQSKLCDQSNHRCKAGAK